MPSHPIRTLFILMAALMATPAFAQSTSGTSGANATMNAVVKAGGEALRRQAEEAAGRVFTSDQVELIKDVLARTTGVDLSRTDTESDRDGSDDDRDEISSKKDKKYQKNKNKGKGRKGGLPPGLAKKNKLPPGLQKRLDRGEPLPPGLARRQLPTDLEQRLGAPAQDTERAIIDKDVVLIDRATGVVLDIIRDVLGGR